MKKFDHYKPGDYINGYLFKERLSNEKKYHWIARGIFECPICKKDVESGIRRILLERKSGICICPKRTLIRHGQTNARGYRSPTYRCWTGMIKRADKKCEEYKNKLYANVEVSERWRDFRNFLVDMGERPSLNHTLDRYPDKRGNYEPGNVRWATKKEQARNLTNNLIVMYMGQGKTLQEWCEVLGLEYNRMRERIFKKKMSSTDAFTLPKRYDQLPNRLIPHSFGVIAS